MFRRFLVLAQLITLLRDIFKDHTSKNSPRPPDQARHHRMWYQFQAHPIKHQFVGESQTGLEGKPFEHVPCIRDASRMTDC